MQPKYWASSKVLYIFVFPFAFKEIGQAAKFDHAANAIFHVQLLFV